MKQLALDTSTDACAVGLQIDSQTFAEDRLEPRGHASILMPMISTLLEDHGLAVQDLDFIALGNGPGSFIGMRIGASVAQGLAFAAELDIVPVTSLAVVAAGVFAKHGASRVIVTQDARMGQVYLESFRRGRDDLPVSDADAVLHDAALPVDPGEPGCVVAGGGWKRYPGLLAALPAGIDFVVDTDYPTARPLLACAAKAHAEGQAVDPQKLEPAYVRQTVATPPAEAGRGPDGGEKARPKP